MICDAAARPLGFVLLPGQTAELKAAPALRTIAALGRLLRVVCDQAYGSAAWRAAIRAAGAEPSVPANPTHPPAGAYRRRH